LTRRFGLHIGFGYSLVGGADASGGGCCLGADSAIFTLAIEEQPATRGKDEGRDNKDGKTHGPAPRIAIAGFG
jgi:hypothetical protein